MVLAHSGNIHLRALPAKGQERFLKAQNLQSTTGLACSDKMKLLPILAGAPLRYQDCNLRRIKKNVYNFPSPPFYFLHRLGGKKKMP